MTLQNILLFTGLALVFRLVSLPSALERWPQVLARGRGWFLFAASILAVFWLQPLTPIRNLDFWLPVLTLALALLGWVLTTPPEARATRANLIALGVLAGLVLLVALTRYLSLDGILTAARPPQTLPVLLVVAGLAALAALLLRFAPLKSAVFSAAILGLIALFLVLKLPALGLLASIGLRGLAGQSTNLAAAADLRWLGFSYVAFRLIHTLRDRQNGRLPVVGFQEYLTYAIFFPALAAGPIDRLERFIKDLRQPGPFAASELGAAGERLVVGLFKKFVVADTLALVALGPLNAVQVRTAGWMWVVLYAYTLQIFFDFSGYTDIAIGLGRLLGVRLPENFNAPYIKTNLALFWNNWHMSLTQWFRAYYFNPITRWLRRFKHLAAWVVILFTQLTTMLLIGLWHGVTWNFVAWGAWHGIGMFVQNRYSDWARGRFPLDDRPRLQSALNVFNGLLTFHFVALGWVWFALPDIGMSVHVMLKLFGLG